MKVLADLHHNELYHSLQLLFEERLGAELYRPIGLEWYEQGYWYVYPHIDTARQFLGTDQAVNTPKDVHGNLLPNSARVNAHYRVEDGIYYVTDPTKDKIQRGVTLEKFRDMDFDVLISSIPSHIQPFNQLISQSHPKAKHIFQVGNAWGHREGIKNILASTAPFSVPSDINICFYHQEFDLEVFRYEIPEIRNVVSSFIHWMKRKELMNSYASNFLGWEWKSFGAGMEDTIPKTSNLAKKIRKSTFVWHYKPEGDGYGHVIHNSFACGRPPIVWGAFYNGKLADALIIDGETCIDVSKHLYDENVRLIKKFSQPEEHNIMCEKAYKRFKEVVDFNREEEVIRRFLENLR